jgi:hypothetical protein
MKAWFGKLSTGKQYAVVIGVIVLVVAVLGAAGGSGSKKSDDSASSGGSDATAEAADTTKKSDSKTKSAPAAKKVDDGCGVKATDDCTPHLGAAGTVRVDAMLWKVKSVRVAKTIGDETYGLGSKADGRYVMVSLQVRSDKDESATLTDNVFQLEIDGNKYDPDTEGTVAAVGAGEDPFFLKDIGPDVVTSGKVVFDVPASALKKKVEMRFNELGFGPTHGYILIPQSRLA